MSKFATSVTLLTIVLSGCAGEQAVNDEQTVSAEEKSSMRTDDELQRRLEVRRGGNKLMPEQVPQDITKQVVGEVPEAILQSIKEDLAKRVNDGAGDADVVKAEAVTWNDGSLGCPKPGEMYTQALVPGYWIILQHGGIQYDYRATERGYFFLCEMPGPLRPPFDKQ